MSELNFDVWKEVNQRIFKQAEKLLSLNLNFPAVGGERTKSTTESNLIPVPLDRFEVDRDLLYSDNKVDGFEPTVGQFAPYQTFGDIIRRLESEITSLRAEVVRLNCNRQELEQALKMYIDAGCMEGTHYANQHEALKNALRLLGT